MSFEDGGETIPGELNINQDDDIIIVTETDTDKVDAKTTEMKANTIESKEVEKGKEASIEGDKAYVGGNKVDAVTTVVAGKGDAENGDQKADNGITSDNEASSHYRFLL